MASGEGKREDAAAAAPTWGERVAYTEEGAREYGIPSLKQVLREKLGVRRLLVAEEWWERKGSRDECTVYDVVFLVLFRGGEARVRAECCRDDRRGRMGERLAVCRIISVKVKRRGRLEKLFS
ncbi:MAG: hypothetical protein QXJ59_04520 [Thermofilaceae archaeon]